MEDCNFIFLIWFSNYPKSYYGQFRIFLKLKEKKVKCGNRVGILIYYLVLVSSIYFFAHNSFSCFSPIFLYIIIWLVIETMGVYLLIYHFVLISSIYFFVQFLAFSLILLDNTIWLVIEKTGQLNINYENKLKLQVMTRKSCRYILLIYVKLTWTFTTLERVYII